MGAKSACTLVKTPDVSVLVVTRKLPRGFLRSPPRFIRNELVEHDIVKPNEPVLGKIRSALRTEWIIPETRGLRSLLEIMRPLHVGLTQRQWWQDATM